MMSDGGRATSLGGGARSCFVGHRLKKRKTNATSGCLECRRTHIKPNTHVHTCVAYPLGKALALLSLTIIEEFGEYRRVFFFVFSFSPYYIIVLPLRVNSSSKIPTRSVEFVQ